MKKHKIMLSFLTVILPILLAAISANAAVQKQNEDQKLLEELTGKKSAISAVAKPQATVTTATQKNVAAVPVSRKLLDAGFFAFTKKDYISALKHYNTIIVKYPKSNELHLAYLAKAKLYQAMGLIEQAQYNIKLANEAAKNNKAVK